MDIFLALSLLTISFENKLSASFELGERFAPLVSSSSSELSTKIIRNLSGSHDLELTLKCAYGQFDSRRKI